MMKVERRGQYANELEAASGTDFAFVAKRTGGKVDQNDIAKELFELGMWGELYTVFIRTPDEFPEHDNPVTEVFAPDQAIKLLADWLGYTVLDRKGQVITGGTN
jgi:hypothetical protein